MIKEYFMYSNVLNYYRPIGIDNKDEKSGLLYLLFMSFNPRREWLFIDRTENEVYITQHFFGDEEEDDVTLELTAKNYNYILDQWNKVIDRKPKYFVLSWNDNNWIDLELKYELLIEDQKYLDQEKIKKLSK